MAVSEIGRCEDEAARTLPQPGAAACAASTASRMSLRLPSATSATHLPIVMHASLTLLRLISPRQITFVVEHRTRVVAVGTQLLAADVDLVGAIDDEASVAALHFGMLQLDAHGRRSACRMPLSTR